MFRSVTVKALVILLMILWISPLLIVVVSALRPTQQIISRWPGQGIDVTVSHFSNVLSHPFFWEALRNSAISSVLATIVCIGAAAASAWASVNLSAKDSLKGFFGWALSTRVLPPITILIPLFALGRFLGVVDSIVGLSLVLAAANLPLAMWLIRGYFREVPIAVREAMSLDSWRETDVFFRVVLPLSARGVIVTGLLCFVLSWNEYLFPLVLTTDPGSKTLAILVGDFVTGYQIEWGSMFACATLMLLPPLLVSALLYPSVALLVGASRRRSSK